MDPEQIKAVFDVISQLQASFRHIKVLCGKYLEIQTGSCVYPPYNEYPMYPMGYGPLPGGYGGQQFYYQPPPPLVYQQQQRASNISNRGNQAIQKILNGNNNVTKSQNAKNRIQPKLGPTVNSNSQNRTKMVVFQKNQKPLVIQPKNPLNPQPKVNEMPQINKPEINKVYRVEQKSNTDNHKNLVKRIPQSPYQMFLMNKKDQIKKQYPQLNEHELSEIMSEVWKSFNSEEKKPYELQWKQLKISAQKQAYRNNPKHTVSGRQPTTGKPSMTGKPPMTGKPSMTEKPTISEIAKSMRNQLSK